MDPNPARAAMDAVPEASGSTPPAVDAPPSGCVPHSATGAAPLAAADAPPPVVAPAPLAAVGPPTTPAIDCPPTDMRQDSKEPVEVAKRKRHRAYSQAQIEIIEKAHNEENLGYRSIVKKYGHFGLTEGRDTGRLFLNRHT